MIQIQPEIGETIQGRVPNQKNSSGSRIIMSTDLPSEINSEKGDPVSESLNSEVPKKKSHWLIWLIIFLVLIGLGVGAYFLIFKGDLGLFGF